jgi:K+-transporting ATPase ATPase C chain
VTTTPLSSSSVRQIGASLRTLLVLTVLLGLAYPLVVTGVAQLTMAGNAGGSLVHRGGRVVGSDLIGQSFRGDPAYLQSRPSVAGQGYDPRASGASNLGPTSPVLVSAERARRAAVVRLDGVAPRQVPADAVQASGSGLDPDISPAYAAIQVRRVAAARHLPVATVRRLVDRYTTGRTLGFLGEPRVDVLDVNLALDALTGTRR